MGERIEVENYILGTIIINTLIIIVVLVIIIVLLLLCNLVNSVLNIVNCRIILCSKYCGLHKQTKKIFQGVSLKLILKTIGSFKELSN